MQPEQCYVINLDQRLDRMNSFQALQPLWRKTFGCEPIRVAAIDGLALPGYGQKPWFKKRICEPRQRSWAGKAGCVLSHRAVIERARNCGARTVLIVEDDALLNPESAQQWQETVAAWVARLPANWVAVYLYAHKPRQPVRQVEISGTLRLLEVAGASTTVAYLLNGRVFDALLKELPDTRTIWSWVARHKTIDRWYAANLNRFGSIYVCAPSIVLQQKIGCSDISMSAQPIELLDAAHSKIHLTHGHIAFQILYRLVRMQNNVWKWCSMLRLLAKRLRGL